jgi:hypothetical protein
MALHRGRRPERARQPYRAQSRATAAEIHARFSRARANRAIFLLNHSHRFDGFNNERISLVAPQKRNILLTI